MYHEKYNFNLINRYNEYAIISYFVSKAKISFRIQGIPLYNLMI